MVVIIDRTIICNMLLSVVLVAICYSLLFPTCLIFSLWDNCRRVSFSFFFEATGGELVLVSTVFNKLGNGVHCCVSIILQNCTHFQLSLFILCICCSVDKYNHFLIEKKKEISCQPVYLFFLFFFSVSLGCPDGL